MSAATLTGLYQARLSSSTGQAARTVQTAVKTSSLTRAGATSAAITAVAQAVAGAETLAYLRALIADAAGVQLEDVDPFTLPSDLIGYAANGQPLHELTGLAPAVYRARLNAGWPEDDAIAAAAAWLDSIVNSEAYRAASRTVVDNALADKRLTGRIGRVTHAGACPFCELIADRGYVPATAGFKAHRACKCTAAPEIRRRAA